MKSDPRVDAYIAKAAPFAQPILNEVRARFHAACPDGEEAIKWSMPFFVYQGRLLANMAAFKAHAAFGFWKQGEVVGGESQAGEAMGQFGRLTSVDDLPSPEAMTALIRKAMAVGPAKAPKPATPKPPVEPPEDLVLALAANATAQAGWDRFAPGQKREYVDWIVEAKRAETRAKRLAQAVEWIAEGKTRNWKYAAC